MSARGEPPLVPVRFRAGWLVSYNQLREIDPETLAAGDPRWEPWMQQDLMQLKLVATNLLVDVGWYPDADPTGHYNVMVLFDQDWQNPVETFSTRVLAEVLAKVEELMQHPPTRK